MPADNDDIKVEYTVKELLATIKNDQTAGFAKLDGQLAGKADKADLVTIHARLDEHGQEIGSIKDRMRADEAANQALETVKSRRLSNRQWAIGLAVLVFASVVGTLIGLLVH